MLSKEEMCIRQILCNLKHKNFQGYRRPLALLRKVPHRPSSSRFGAFWGSSITLKISKHLFCWAGEGVQIRLRMLKLFDFIGTKVKMIFMWWTDTYLFNRVLFFIKKSKKVSTSTFLIISNTKCFQASLVPYSVFFLIAISSLFFFL